MTQDSRHRRRSATVAVAALGPRLVERLGELAARRVATETLMEGLGRLLPA